MADAYIGEIRIFAGNFAPYGWALCNGQLLSISQNTALYSILGVQFGGDGKTTFALPNLMGRAPMHQGSGAGLSPRKVGEMTGSTTETLLTNQMPGHTHIPQAVNTQGTTSTSTNNYWAQSPLTGPPNKRTQVPLYNGQINTTMKTTALNIAGGSQPHNNMQPYIPQNFIICLQGEFPSRG